jgi:transposase InsO family protein
MRGRIASEAVEILATLFAKIPERHRPYYSPAARFRILETLNLLSTLDGAAKVVARFVHHVWMMDVSHVQQFLGPELLMATVFDAFSRLPLALRVFEAKPRASDMAQLLGLAANAFAKPRHVITDRGGEFTAAAFRKAVARLGAVQRFAAKDSIHATARLERFWRTLKQNAGLYRLHLPLTPEELERRLELALLHYIAFRPHEGLKGATPAEAFFGVEPSCMKAVDPLRAPPGNAADRPFYVEYLDPANRRFPILKPAA